MEGITPEQARDALAIADNAQRGVAAEVGMPRAYWWGLAAGWLALGTIGEFAPPWVTTIATVAFGAGHATVASRFLDGRRRTSRLQVSSSVAGPRTPLVVIGMLLALVALTIGISVGLDADGADHAALWGGLFVAAVVGLGGPEILAVLRRWTHA